MKFDFSERVKSAIMTCQFSPVEALNKVKQAFMKFWKLKVESSKPLYGRT